MNITSEEKKIRIESLEADIKAQTKIRQKIENEISGKEFQLEQYRSAKYALIADVIFKTAKLQEDLAEVFKN